MKNRSQLIYRVTWVGFFANLLLSVAKLIAGVIGKSGAMLADGIHSLSDLITDVVVLAFVKVSSKPRDEDHNYGHGKYETLATILIGIALFFVAVGVVYNSIKAIINIVNGNMLTQPGVIALVAAAISIIVKECLFQYTKHIGVKVDSPAIIANAWHHRSDAFSSIGTLLGVGGAYFLGNKWCILDPIAAVIVGLLICKVSYDLIKPGIGEILERSLPKELEDKLCAIVLSNKKFSDIHNIKTRRIGSGIAVEMHVRVPGSMTVEESHSATVDVEQKIREAFGEQTQVILHVEPHKCPHCEHKVQD